MAAVTKNHRLERCIFSRSWRLTVQGQVSAGQDSSEASLLGVETAVLCLRPHTVLPLPECPNVLSLSGHQPCWLKTHPNDLILTGLPLSRPSLQTAMSQWLGSGGPVNGGAHSAINTYFPVTLVLTLEHPECFLDLPAPRHLQFWMQSEFTPDTTQGVWTLLV